ncbi:hypothetical protein ACFL4Q_04610, partial [candidate division KSB1 bacterium]
MKKAYIFLAAVFLGALISSSLYAQSYAITNATVVTVTGGTIANGTVVIEGDRIAAVGTSVQIPPGAERIDGTGLFVYPGIIDVNTAVGLVEISGIWQTTDNTESGTYNTYIRASQGVNSNSNMINIGRFNGLTSVITVPNGGIIAGQEVLLNLDGWTVDEMTVKDPVAMQFTFPVARSGGGRGGRPQQESGEQQVSPEDRIKEVKDLLEKTRRYIKAVEDFEAQVRPTPPPADLTLMALIPVVKREIPMTITVSGVDNIRKAIDFVVEENIKAVFAGANEAYKIANEIADAGIGVIYSDVLRLPGMEEPYDLYYTIPRFLYEAGVQFAINISNQSDIRNTPFLAGMAAAYGLPKEEALRSVTINPARMYGID